MRKILQLIVAGAVVAAASVVPSVGASPKASAPGSTFKNKYDNTTIVRDCPQDDGSSAGTITYAGPIKLWPPNHKYANATVTATDEDSGDNVSMTTTGTHDQYDGDTGTETNGAGNTADDITPAAQTKVDGTGSVVQHFQIRSERSGRLKDGRTYTITADAVFTDSDGDGSSEAETTCHQEFQVFVPHDMRNG